MDSAPKFSLLANFHIPRLRDFDLMEIINSRIYMGFNSENRSGFTFTPNFLHSVKNVETYLLA